MNKNLRNTTKDLKDGQYTKLKRWLVGLSGVMMLYVSLIFSKEGIGIQGNYAWMGYVIAVALSCSEFMFNSNFESLNWTIFVIGLTAYGYSIWTNVVGFYVNRGMTGNMFSNFDPTNVFGGIFLDVYPEVAIAWALKESKIGDLLGNAIKTFRKPESMTSSKNGLEDETSNAPKNFSTPTPSYNRPYGRMMESKSANKNQTPFRTGGKWADIDTLGQDLEEFQQNRENGEL